MKPPSHNETEMALIGCLLQDSKIITDVQANGGVNLFYATGNANIYTAILNNKGADAVTVAAALRDSGVAEYLSKCLIQAPSPLMAGRYIETLKDLYIKREFLKVMQNGIYYIDNADILTTVEQQLREVVKKISKAKFTDYADAVDSLWLDYVQNEGTEPDYMKTGIADLDRLIDGIEHTEHVIVAGRPSMGKCLGKGTRVLAWSGKLVNVEDIRTGMLLMGPDSQYRKVLSTIRGREQMYWVKQNRGIDYRVNESHILSLKKSSNGGLLDKGSIINISLREYQRKSNKFKSRHKGYKVCVEFKEKSLSLDPYFLGLWLGDGKASGPQIYTVDDEVINYLRSYALSRGAGVTKGDINRPCSSYTITVGRHIAYQQNKNSIKSTLKDIGVLNDKHIPNDYLINSKENRLRLLAGLIDSDGHYNRAGGDDSGPYEITLKPRKLCEQIKFLCDSLGYRTSLKEKWVNYKGKMCLYYRIRFNGNVDEIPVLVKRKKAKKWTDIADWTLSTITLEKDIEDDYYGFELSGDGLFLLEDMTVTHNTALATDIVRAVAKQGFKVNFHTMEMSEKALTRRFVCAEANISLKAFRNRRLTADQKARAAGVSSMIARGKLNIFDGRVTVSEIKAEVLKTEPDLIVVDYLQLMSLDRRAGMTTNDLVGDNATGLQAIAKSGPAVITISQLSRASEKEKRRPGLADLYESGKIEAVGDKIIMPYREDKESEEAEILVVKQKDGPVGAVDVKFLREAATFRGLEIHREPPDVMAGGKQW